MIRRELKRRLRSAWRRLVFRVRVHWHAVAVADALHEIEDETALYLFLHRGDDRALFVLRRARDALLDCGRGVKGFDE